MSLQGDSRYSLNDMVLKGDKQPIVGSSTLDRPILLGENACLEPSLDSGNISRDCWANKFPRWSVGQLGISILSLSF
jgi:hypothetical protein